MLNTSSGIESICLSLSTGAVTWYSFCHARMFHSRVHREIAMRCQGLHANALRMAAIASQLPACQTPSSIGRATPALTCRAPWAPSSSGRSTTPRPRTCSTPLIGPLCGARSSVTQQVLPSTAGTTRHVSNGSRRVGGS